MAEVIAELLRDADWHVTARRWRDALESLDAARKQIEIAQATAEHEEIRRQLAADDLVQLRRLGF